MMTHFFCQIVAWFPHHRLRVMAMMCVMMIPVGPVLLLISQGPEIRSEVRVTHQSLAPGHYHS